MNYYYDLKLNFFKNLINTYEWLETDEYKYYKKLPLILVNNKTWEDIYNYNFIMNNNLESNVVIFTSKKGSIAIMFDINNKSIKRSFLPLNDEINILDIIYTLKQTKINYKLKDKIEFNKYSRIEISIKETIKEEIKKLKNKKDYDKLNYIYLELFNTTDINMDIDKLLEEKLNNNLKRVYDLIKLSNSSIK